MSAGPKLTAELENGAVMTREEFHAAYERCEGLRRAELIEGVVFMPSPVHYEGHDKEAALLRGWLFNYTLLHSDVETGGDATLLLQDSEVQPDGFLMRAGSLARQDNYIVGAPQLVAEVAGSSKSRDLHGKLREYLANGVEEYLVWRTLDGEVDWFRRAGSEFVKILPDNSGIIESSSFPGLRLHIESLLALDSRKVVSYLA